VNLRKDHYQDNNNDNDSGGTWVVAWDKPYSQPSGPRRGETIDPGAGVGPDGRDDCSL